MSDRHENAMLEVAGEQQRPIRGEQAVSVHTLAHCRPERVGRMKVQLRTNPEADGAFRLMAERMLGDRPVSPEGLQSVLRDVYPRAAVVRGIEDHGWERWYAYRDGHWTGPIR